MWNVQCVSLVDMTRFASFRTQTIAEVPCHVILFCEALYRWHGTYAFFCFFTLQMTWEFSFFGYVRQLPCHLQVLSYTSDVCIWVIDKIIVILILFLLRLGQSEGLETTLSILFPCVEVVELASGRMVTFFGLWLIAFVKPHQIPWKPTLIPLEWCITCDAKA